MNIRQILTKEIWGQANWELYLRPSKIAVGNEKKKTHTAITPHPTPKNDDILCTLNLFKYFTCHLVNQIEF